MTITAFISDDWGQGYGVVTRQATSAITITTSSTPPLPPITLTTANYHYNYSYSISKNTILANHHKRKESNVVFIIADQVQPILRTQDVPNAEPRCAGHGQQPEEESSHTPWLIGIQLWHCCACSHDQLRPGWGEKNLTSWAQSCGGGHGERTGLVIPQGKPLTVSLQDLNYKDPAPVHCANQLITLPPSVNIIFIGAGSDIIGRVSSQNDSPKYSRCFTSTNISSGSRQSKLRTHPHTIQPDVELPLFCTPFSFCDTLSNRTEIWQYSPKKWAFIKFSIKIHIFAEDFHKLTWPICLFVIKQVCPPP